VEKIDNIMGSCAGAGSSEFDLYRAARKRERLRIEAIEKDYAEKQARKELEDRVAKNRQEAEERTRKNAEKRKRKQAKKKMFSKGDKKGKVTNEDETDNDEEEDNHDIAVDASNLHATVSDSEAANEVQPSIPSLEESSKHCNRQFLTRCNLLAWKNHPKHCSRLFQHFLLLLTRKNHILIFLKKIRSKKRRWHEIASQPCSRISELQSKFV